MNMTSDKSKKLDRESIKEEISWDTICNQVNKERFDPYYTNVYGISLTESKYRRKK